MSNLNKILFSPISTLLKLQKHTLAALNRLGIYKVRDLLLYRPHSYSSFTICTDNVKLSHGQQVIVEVTVNDIEKHHSRKSPIKVYTESVLGPIVLVFFNSVPAFIFSKLKIGSKHVVEGKVELNQGFYFQITHPNFLLNQNQVRETQPIYHLTYGITNKQLYGYILRAIEVLEPHFDEMPRFKELLVALKSMHIPNIQESKNIELLAKYELLANQFMLLSVRQQNNKVRGRSFNIVDHSIILSDLGFILTEGQEEVIKEIENDQIIDSRMVRMLQGDVGSGKTLVALLTMMNVAMSNVQSVLMAPTDLLANQHFDFFSRALANTGLKVALLTGKVKSKSRKDVLDGLENGEIDILIGTHAVFQEKVNFKDLGYIVIDEQHRFGVEQRLELINKATMPDLLVMTATPIPRSLTLTLFGDMASSRLTSKPKGRLPIITKAMSRTYMDEVIASLERKLEKGEKVYWICPLIEKSDIEDADDKLMDVATRYESLLSIYPNQVGFVHGAMKNDQKDAAMQDFKNGITKILVATTVIEVGIDVPDATLIIIENAEKFGLAQLHQLRGRVGRSSLQSHAVLLYEQTRCSSIAKQRLETMRVSDDGFYIAEQDLILRGGGEILGTKQSGEQEFIFADLVRDIALLTECNAYANKALASSENFDFLVGLFDRVKRE
ncbi:MAG: ATP-dependent helicase RecG, partial [Pseudomonadota bacterium]